MTEYLDLFRKIASDHDLPLDLVLGICRTESNFNPKAIRYEKGWTYQFGMTSYSIKSGYTFDTEKILQSCSFGMLQIMGGVARELGFDKSLIELFNPEVGLEYGCIKLKKLKDTHDSLEDVISSYNQGSPIKENGRYRNQVYVDKVKLAMLQFKDIK